MTRVAACLLTAAVASSATLGAWYLWPGGGLLPWLLALIALAAAVLGVQWARGRFPPGAS